MTLQELYQNMDADYEQAMRVLRMEKLLDKHIRKLAKNELVDQLVQAGERMDPEGLFEAAHALKGVCANLGLTCLSEAASKIAEEYRPGEKRHLTDAEVKEIINGLVERYQKTTEEIRKYEGA